MKLDPNLQSQLTPYAQKFLEEYQPQIKEINTVLPDKALLLEQHCSQRQKDYLIRVSNAVKSWSASTSGRESVQNLSCLSLTGVRKALPKILWQMLHETPQLAAALDPKEFLENMDFPVNSITIGFDAEFIFIVGISVSVGIAIGIDELSALKSLLDGDGGDFDFGSGFLSISLDEGIVEAAMGSLQIGISNSNPTDMGGWGCSIEIIADPGVGVTLSLDLNLGPISLNGATIAIDGGEGGGVGIQESYTFMIADIDYYIPPMFQPRRSHMLILHKLTCKDTSEWHENDEVYLKFTPDDGATYPYPSWDYRSMDDNSYEDTWELGRSIWFDNQIKIEIWDSDGTTDDDLIAKKVLHFSDEKIQELIDSNNKSTQTYTFEDDGKYTLTVGLMF